MADLVLVYALSVLDTSRELDFAPCEDTPLHTCCYVDLDTDHSLS